MAKFIICACPTGELAQQIQQFLAESRRSIGPNQAHNGLLCCPLVSGLEDTVGSVPLYTQGLLRAYNRAQRSRPTAAITVVGFTFRPDWHGLSLESVWLQQLMVDFASTLRSPTRQGRFRLKHWLELRWASEFAPAQAKLLSTLAKQRIDPSAPVGWELRYYQNSEEHTWICHQALPIA